MNKSINKQFEYLGLEDKSKYNYKDKTQNVLNSMTYMFNRSLIMFKYHNLPETIPEVELERFLQTTGFSVIAPVNGKLYAFTGGLGGEPDMYYRPTQVVISNPFLNYNATLNIDKDCVLIKNDSNCIGLAPMYAKYLTQLSEAEITLLLALVNKRVQAFLTASDDTTKASAENFVKKLFDGDLAVIGTSQLFDGFNTHDANNKSDKTLEEIYEIIKYIKGDLFNEIGLASYNTAKKERVSQAELDLNTDNLYPLVDNMLDTRRKGIEKLNTMYGLNVEVELNSSWDYRIFNGESIHNTKEEISIDDVNRTAKSDENNNEEKEEVEPNTETVEEHKEEES